MSSLKWVPAVTPSSLATARADGVLTFRLRIRACFAARNTRLSGSAPRAAWSRGAWIWEGPRGEPAAPPHPAGRCCARRASAHAHPAAVPRPCPADPRTLQSGAQAAAAAQVPPTGRRRHGGTYADPARRRQRAAESSERVLCARGRQVVCKRRLLPAARGLSGEPEGVGRLRMNDAALCRALCRFRTAAVDRGHGGRAAAGGQHTRVCRRTRPPCLVSSKRYVHDPARPPDCRYVRPFRAALGEAVHRRRCRPTLRCPWPRALVGPGRGRATPGIRSAALGHPCGLPERTPCTGSCVPPRRRATHTGTRSMILEFPSFNIGTAAMRATMRCGASCLRPAQSPKWVMTVTGTGGAPLAVPTHSAAAGSLIAAPMIGTRRRWLDGPAADRQISIRGLRKRAENARARPGRADQAHCASRVAQEPLPLL